jgi:HEPN domain-containing protein
MNLDQRPRCLKQPESRTPIDGACPAPDTADMAQRAADWFRQAERDLEQARDSATAGRHEWACFAAQQAAEKAVKALHLHVGQDAWGHVVRMLLEELPDSVTVPEELLDQARVLDAFYIPARYPNGHAAGAPADHYGKLQSEDAIRHASAIIEFARAGMA